MLKPIATLSLLVAATSSFAQSASNDNTLIPTISCLSKPSVFNTGIDDTTGVQITPGQTDPQWFGKIGARSSTAPASGGWNAFYVPATNYDPALNAQLNTRNPGGRTDVDWISPMINGTSTGGGGLGAGIQAYYRTQFNLAPEVPPTALNFSLDYRVDDAVEHVFINGISSPSGFSQLTGPWNTGLNSVIYSVLDIGWISGLVVFADPNVQSVCDVSPIRIEKSVSQPSYNTGSTASYTIDVTSLGTVTAVGAQLSDAIPSGLTNPQWSCTATNGATCPATAGSAPFTFDLSGSGKLSFTLTGTVAASGSLVNTATVAPGAGGVCAADSATPCQASATATLIPPALAPNLTPTWPNTAPALIIDSPASFTVNIANLGTAANTDGQVLIQLPAQMQFTGTPPAGCTVTGTAMTCPAPPMGAGAAAATISFSAQATSAFVGESITATISSVTGETMTSDNSATLIVNTTGRGGVTPPTTGVAPVPTLQHGTLLALIALLGIAAVRQRRPLKPGR